LEGRAHTADAERRGPDTDERNALQARVDYAGGDGSVVYVLIPNWSH
jgi:hypothetical protein